MDAKEITLERKRRWIREIISTSRCPVDIEAACGQGVAGGCPLGDCPLYGVIFADLDCAEQAREREARLLEAMRRHFGLRNAALIMHRAGLFGSEDAALAALEGK